MPILYYKKIRIVSFSISVISSIVFVIGLAILLYDDPINILNLIYIISFFCIVKVISLLTFITSIFEIRILENHIRKMFIRCEYKELNDYLKNIDQYYYSKEKGNLYYIKKITLKFHRVRILIILGRIADALEIYYEVVAEYGDKFKVEDKIDSLILYIQIQIEYKDIELVEQGISECRKIINEGKNEKIINKNLNRILYEEIKVLFLKGEYLGLDEKMKNQIEKEEWVGNVIGKKFFLGEIYMKQENYEKAKIQFSEIIVHNEKHYRYKEAENYIHEIEKLQ